MFNLKKTRKNDEFLNFIATDVYHTMATTLTSIANHLHSIKNALILVDADNSIVEKSQSELNKNINAIEKINKEINSSFEYLDIFNKTLSPVEKVKNYTTFRIKNIVSETLKNYPYKTEREELVAHTFSPTFQDASIHYDEEDFIFIIKRILKFVLTYSPAGICQMDMDVETQKMQTRINIKTGVVIDGKNIKALNNTFYPLNTRTCWGFSQLNDLFSVSGYRFEIIADEKMRVCFVMLFLSEDRK